MLLTAIWEAYCEDLSAEALEHIVKHAKAVDDLPVELRKLVAKELKKDPQDLAIWGLAGDNWRALLRQRLADLQQERNRRLNTPKTEQINGLFREALGIMKISDAWYWEGMSRTQAARKLDSYVNLRGEIAHRGAAPRGFARVK